MLAENRISHISRSTLRTRYSQIISYIEKLEKKHRITPEERRKLNTFVRSLYVARRTNERINKYLENSDNTLKKRINRILNRLSKIQ